jgi:hypothetical protein
VNGRPLGPADAQRGRFSLGATRPAIYAAATLACIVAGWLVGGVPDATLVPVTAIVATAVAVALGIMGIRRHLLASPLILLGIPLLLSLAAAMQPITRIFGDWTLSTLTDAVLIVLAPIAGVGAAMLFAREPIKALERGTEAQPYANRLVFVVVAMALAGSAVYAYEWAGIGGPPLLSENIDQARFSLNAGPIHIFTEGIPLALLISTWARVGRPRSFSPFQLRALEGVMGLALLMQGLGGGRSFVIVPVISALVVAARYLTPRATKRMAIGVPVAILVFSSVVFLARIGQHSPTGAVGSVLYNSSGEKTSPFESVYGSLSINLGEQLRVVQELREADIRTPPFSSSIWFAHNFFPSRALDPQVIAGPNAGGWLTSMYAGPLLLDFGLLPALLFGFVLGAGAHVLYGRFARGRSVTIIWIYAYLAASITLAFYINMFTYFIFPILDLTGLAILSRLLIRREPEPAPTAAAA